jgi:hypothetical protein
MYGWEVNFIVAATKIGYSELAFTALTALSLFFFMGSLVREKNGTAL